MTFVSVPPERFLYSVYKTWLRLFKDDAAFANVLVTPTQPDMSEKISFPCVILRRVSSDDLTLTRNSGLHATNHDEISDEVGHLYGYTLLTQVQFDIWAESEMQLLDLTARVRAKLMNPTNAVNAVFRETIGTRSLPIRDWSQPGSPPVTTDLTINWKYHKGVGEQKIPKSASEDIHQSAVNVNFWVDYLSEERVPKILEVQTDMTEVNGLTY